MGADRPHQLTRSIYMIAPFSRQSVAGATCKSEPLDKWIWLSIYGSNHQAKVSNDPSGTIAGGCEEKIYVSKTNNVHCETTIAPKKTLGPQKQTMNTKNCSASGGLTTTRITNKSNE